MSMSVIAWPPLGNWPGRQSRQRRVSAGRRRRRLQAAAGKISPESRLAGHMPALRGHLARTRRRVEIQARPAGSATRPAIPGRLFFRGEEGRGRGGGMPRGPPGQPSAGTQRCRPGHHAMMMMMTPGRPHPRPQAQLPPSPSPSLPPWPRPPPTFRVTMAATVSAQCAAAAGVHCRACMRLATRRRTRSALKHDAVTSRPRRRRRPVTVTAEAGPGVLTPSRRRTARKLQHI